MGTYLKPQSTVVASHLPPSTKSVLQTSLAHRPATRQLWLLKTAPSTSGSWPGLRANLVGKRRPRAPLYLLSCPPSSSTFWRRPRTRPRPSAGDKASGRRRRGVRRLQGLHVKRSRHEKRIRPQRPLHLNGTRPQRPLHGKRIRPQRPLHLKTTGRPSAHATAVPSANGASASAALRRAKTASVPALPARRPSLASNAIDAKASDTSPGLAAYPLYVRNVQGTTTAKSASTHASREHRQCITAALARRPATAYVRGSAPPGPPASPGRPDPQGRQHSQCPPWTRPPSVHQRHRRDTPSPTLPWTPMRSWRTWTHRSLRPQPMSALLTLPRSVISLSLRNISNSARSTLPSSSTSSTCKRLTSYP